VPTTIDPEEAIKQILYANWKLHGDLKRTVESSGNTGVYFSTGVTAASRRYPSIEIVPNVEPSVVLTTIWMLRNASVMVHVFVRPRTTEKDGLESAKQQRKLIVEEIYRILWSQQIELQDISWAHPLDKINADQYHALDDDIGEANRSSSPQSRGDFTPVLHTIVPVETKRFFNAFTGGSQMNRTT
jgi:hypothetical protein